jgi:hypothetical protein
MAIGPTDLLLAAADVPILKFAQSLISVSSELQNHQEALRAAYGRPADVDQAMSGRRECAAFDAVPFVKDTY